MNNSVQPPSPKKTTRKKASPANSTTEQPTAPNTGRSKKNATPKKPPATNAGRKKTASGNDISSRITALVVGALENLKAKNVVTLDVRGLTDVMDTLIIASGTSNRHVKSLADNARVELKKNGYKVYGSEGEDSGEWVLVDFGSVVLHVMQPHVREFYDLERLWAMPAPQPDNG